LFISKKLVKKASNSKKPSNKVTHPVNFAKQKILKLLKKKRAMVK
jgi:hypothetical protein